MKDKGSRRILDSTIGFLAVTNGDDVDESLVIINGENDPVGTHANSPQIFFSPQFPATVRTRIGCQRLDGRKDPTNDRGIQALQFFAG